MREILQTLVRFWNSVIPNDMQSDHPVRKYLEDVGETQGWLAQKAGLSEGYLSNIVRGRARCGAEAARKLVAASRGALSFEDLLR